MVLALVTGRARSGLRIERSPCFTKFTFVSDRRRELLKFSRGTVDAGKQGGWRVASFVARLTRSGRLVVLVLVLSDGAVGAGCCLGRELLPSGAQLAGVLDRSGEFLKLSRRTFLAERGRVGRGLSSGASLAAVDIGLGEFFIAPNRTRRAAA